MNITKGKNSLQKIGYIENNKSYIDDLQAMLIGTSQVCCYEDIMNCVDANTEYYNGAGYMQFPDGTPVSEETARYIRFKVPYKNANNCEIFGWFESRKASFIGVYWGTDKDFKHLIQRNNTFTIGCISFNQFEDGLEFLDDIAINTIPESWKYKNKPSTINYPILKSYIENVLERLKKEADDSNLNKIVYSRDKKYVMFNTNLLDKFFHDVIIVGEATIINNSLFLQNPYRVKSLSTLRQLGFAKNDYPIQPQFFDDINEVIFQTGWEIDKDFDTFTHIIEERQFRFPEEYKTQQSDILARKLDDAIDFAVALAQRNYKFIVPMYRPQTNSIQLLMPIYLNGAYSKHPDFALVLTPDKINELYIPETILPLDAVYQNARLIAKPDESWLDPEMIQ